MMIVSEIIEPTAIIKLSFVLGFIVISVDSLQFNK
jgi:hypothetical protein